MEVGAAEIAAVDEEELVAEGLPGAFRPAGETVEAEEGGLRRDVHDIAHHRRAQQVLDPEFQGLGRFEDADVAAVVAEGESGVGPGQGHAGVFFEDVLEFDVVRLEELAACGDVVEEVPHGEIGALRRLDLAGGEVLGGGEGHLHADLILRPAGLEGHFRHRGDRSEGLPAEAECEDVVEVFRRGDLRRGVALEAEDGVVRAHAAAVVDDLDERAAGIRDDHVHLTRAGIQGVLHQFLHDGGRPLDDLARRDHVRDVPRQYPQFHYRRE